MVRGWTISPYRPEHEEGIRSLEPEFFDWYSGKIGWGTIYVAQIRAQVVGFLFVVWHRGPAYFDETLEPVAEIDEVVVARSLRNQGIGTVLVDRAIADASRRGCRAIYLETDDFNRPARRVYKKCGFRYQNLIIRYKRSLP